MLTKIEWEEKIYKEYFDKYQLELPKDNYKEKLFINGCMHLTEYGYKIFKKVGVKFLNLNYLIRLDCIL